MVLLVVSRVLGLRWIRSLMGALDAVFKFLFWAWEVEDLGAWVVVL